MVYFVTPQKAEIDIHNMTKDEARKYIAGFLSKANKNLREVVIIHGYSQGTVLKDMVKVFSHPRIDRKMLSLNPGQTTFFLK